MYSSIHAPPFSTYILGHLHVKALGVQRIKPGLTLTQHPWGAERRQGQGSSLLQHRLTEESRQEEQSYGFSPTLSLTLIH